MKSSFCSGLFPLSMNVKIVVHFFKKLINNFLRHDEHQPKQFIVLKILISKQMRNNEPATDVPKPKQQQKKSNLNNVNNNKNYQQNILEQQCNAI